MYACLGIVTRRLRRVVPCGSKTSLFFNFCHLLNTCTLLAKYTEVKYGLEQSHTWHGARIKCSSIQFLIPCQIIGYCYGSLKSEEKINSDVHKGGSSAGAPGARHPVLNFHSCIFGNFNSITRINFIVNNMQCLQYVFYSILSLQQHRVCVMGHHFKKYTAPGPRPPVLKFLDPPLVPKTNSAYAIFHHKDKQLLFNDLTGREGQNN